MRVIALLVTGVAVIAGVHYAWPALFPTPVTTSLSATGRIEGREVTLAAKTIRARVSKLMADEGDVVTRGQMLAELEAAQIEAQTAAAAAAVTALDAQIRQTTLDVAYTTKNSQASIDAVAAAVRTAQAQANRARAVQANAESAFTRASSLFRDGVIARQEMDQAEMALRTSEAEVAAADQEVVRAKANVTLAVASADMVGVKQQQVRALEETRRAAQARLDEARATLAERILIASVDGTIVSRSVEVGDVVGPGSPIFTLVDMSRLYVKVYVPEPDIAKLRLGEPADISVDGFPGRRFSAHVSRIYQQAEFTPKNVETAEERLKLVFGVELALDNANGVLKPGMPASCVIRAITPDAGHER